MKKASSNGYNRVEPRNRKWLAPVDPPFKLQKMTATLKRRSLKKRLIINDALAEPQPS
jgi:hypothetical protein